MTALINVSTSQSIEHSSNPRSLSSRTTQHNVNAVNPSLTISENKRTLLADNEEADESGVGKESAGINNICQIIMEQCGLSKKSKGMEEIAAANSGTKLSQGNEFGGALDQNKRPGDIMMAQQPIRRSYTSNRARGGHGIRGRGGYGSRGRGVYGHTSGSGRRGGYQSGSGTGQRGGHQSGSGTAQKGGYGSVRGMDDQIRARQDRISRGGRGGYNHYVNGRGGYTIRGRR